MAQSAMPGPGDSSAASVNLAFVLEQEAIEIQKHGLAEPGEKPDRFGVCFSGGGIRSACVALGVSQSLARHGLLRNVQYISAISGGGYMLGALTAWIKRTEGGFAGVDAALALSADPASPVPDVAEATPGAGYPRFLEPDFIRNLRRYSSYLTPRLGILSGDALAMASIYLRNLLLNLTMMLSAVFALMLVLQTVAPQRLWRHPLPDWAVYGLLVAIGLCFAGAVFAVTHEIQTIRDATGDGSRKFTGVAFGLGFSGCVLLWWVSPTFYTLRNGLRHAVLVAAGLGVLGLVLTWFESMRAHRKAVKAGPAGARVKPVDRVTVWVLAAAWSGAAALSAGIAVGFFEHLAHAGSILVGGTYVIFGLPLIFLSFPLVTYLFIGILGNQLPDAEREWLARFAGYFVSAAVYVALTIAVALDGPAWMDWLLCAMGKWGWQGALAALLPGGWAYVTLSGVVLGRSSATSGQKPAYNFKNVMVAVAPFVFLAGLLVQVSWGANALLMASGSIASLVSAPALSQQPAVAAKGTEACCERVACADKPTAAAAVCVLQRQTPAPLYAGQFEMAEAGKHNAYAWYFGWLGGFVGLAGLLAWRLDINEFSMHLFYRNRLVRAFAGASKLNRQANVFTNFSLSDDFPLRSLVMQPTDKSDRADGKDVERAYDGPYPIWGTSLNMTHGEDLSWQQRKAASFIYSPLFCGWDYNAPMGVPVDLVRVEPAKLEQDQGDLADYGFRFTERYGGEGGKPLIGTAMAASGAAASPNMGYHTRAGVAALLALFNVRLGWWTGNPRNNETWCRYAPGAYYLLNELLGSTDATSPYVYLSDGGHFENLGLYELVRRRLRFIIVSDAACDGAYRFADVGNAIEHCRRDFGVQIDLHPAQDMAAVLNNALPLDDQRLFRKEHYAVGTIRYPRLPEEKQATVGYLLYLKSSLTGDEPADVLAMRTDYPSFPHDSTGNQFFNESLFESYRALGEHMMSSVLEPKAAGVAVSETEAALFVELKKLMEKRVPGGS